MTLFRPVPCRQRWHTVTVLQYGGFSYGLVPPDGLVLPMVAYVQRRPVLLGPDWPHEVPAPRLDALGFRSYLGLPLVVDDRVLAVLEAVDMVEPERLDGYASTLQAAMAALTAALDAGEGGLGTGTPLGAPGDGLNEATVLDLVLRPPVDEDDTFEVLAEDWAVLSHVDGERPFPAVAVAAGMAASEAPAIAAGSLERGQHRVGREDHRREGASYQLSAMMDGARGDGVRHQGAGETGYGRRSTADS